MAQHMNFKLSDVSGSLTNEIGLYSHYKIRKVVVKFLPRFQIVQENASIVDGEEFGFWGYSPDYNGTLPDYNTIAEVYADSMGKIRRGWKGFKAVIVPKVRVPTYTGSLAVDYMNINPGWLETYDDDTQYNGLRWIWEGNINATKTVTFDMHVVYYIAFKGLRKNA